MTTGNINLNCPGCRNLQSVPSSMVGQQVRCAICQVVFVVPTNPVPNIPTTLPPVPTTSPPVAAPQAIVRGPQSVGAAPLAKPIASRWANPPQSMDPMAPMLPVPPAAPPVPISVAPPAPPTPRQMAPHANAPSRETKEAKRRRTLPKSTKKIESDDEPEVSRSRFAPFINIAVVVVGGLMLLLGTVTVILYAQGKLVLPSRQIAQDDVARKRADKSEKSKEEPLPRVEETATPIIESPPSDDSPAEKPPEAFLVKEKEKQYPTGIPRVVEVDPKAIGPIKWQDARDVSLVMQRVKARVDRFEIGAVMGRDSANNLVAVDSRSYLSVFVTLKNQGKSALEYHSWNREGGSSRTRHKPATLVDNLGRSYEISTFQGLQRVRGVATEKKLIPGDEVQDVIVFAHPAGDMDEVKYFMLSLPGSAFGGEGTYRFEVPMSMLKGW